MEDSNKVAWISSTSEGLISYIILMSDTFGFFISMLNLIFVFIFKFSVNWMSNTVFDVVKSPETTNTFPNSWGD